MMRYAKSVAILAVFWTLAAADPGYAALVQVSSRADLGATLTIPWTTFGAVGSGIAVFEQLPVGPEEVRLNSSSGVLDISEQGSGTNADFSPSSVLLVQPNGDDGILIGFDAPVLGFGTDIDPYGYTGPFTAYMQAFDAEGNLLGIISVAGTETGSGDGSAPFIGATSFSDPISYLNFGLVEPDNTDVPQFTLVDGMPVLGNVAIDEASVILPVPEPASLALFTAGLAGLLTVRRRRRY